MTRFPALPAAQHTTETDHPLSYTTAGSVYLDAEENADTAPCPEDDCTGRVVDNGATDPRATRFVCTVCRWSA